MAYSNLARFVNRMVLVAILLVAILQLVGLVPGFSDHPGMNMSIWDGGRLSTLVGTCEQHEIVMQRSKSV